MYIPILVSKVCRKEKETKISRSPNNHDGNSATHFHPYHFSLPFFHHSTLGDDHKKKKKKKEVLAAACLISTDAAVCFFLSFFLLDDGVNCVTVFFLPTPPLSLSTLLTAMVQVGGEK